MRALARVVDEELLARAMVLPHREALALEPRAVDLAELRVAMAVGVTLEIFAAQQLQRDAGALALHVDCCGADAFFIDAESGIVYLGRDYALPDGSMGTESSVRKAENSKCVVVGDYDALQQINPTNSQSPNCGADANV